MDDDIRIIQNMIYELFAFYHRILMVIIEREDIHLGSYFQDYINGNNTKYSQIQEYIRFLNDIIFYIESGEENTRNQDMGFINSQLLEPEYIKHTFIPVLNLKLSKLKPNQIKKEYFAEIINSIFFEINERIFQYDPLDLFQLFLKNKEDLGELTDEVNYMYQQNPQFNERKIVEYKTNRHTSSLKNTNITKLEKLIYFKTDRIYEKNIRKWIQYIKKKRHQLKEYIAPLPHDLYQNISIMMGVPEMSKSPLQSKTKSAKKSAKKSGTQRARAQ
jgi:hypothetical protein